MVYAPTKGPPNKEAWITFTQRILALTQSQSKNCTQEFSLGDVWCAWKHCSRPHEISLVGCTCVTLCHIVSHCVTPRRTCIKESSQNVMVSWSMGPWHQDRNKKRLLNHAGSTSSTSMCITVYHPSYHIVSYIISIYHINYINIYIYICTYVYIYIYHILISTPIIQWIVFRASVTGHHGVLPQKSGFP